MRRIVSNTGPVIHLCQVGLLRLLGLAGEVRIPPAVGTEARRWGAIAGQLSAGLLLETLDKEHASEAAGWQRAGLLDPGEAEALALARQIRADWLLTDDAAARLLGEALGLEVHGSLGVILWAAGAGHLNEREARAALDGLARSSLWVSERVLQEARAALRELLRHS